MTVVVTVVYAAPGVESVVRLALPDGAVLADAVAMSCLLDRHELDPRRLGYAIFGERATPATPLVDGDRVELTRPLIADPKDLRRQRAARTSKPRLRTKSLPRNSA
ncbi:MAG TPA: RnfH family protein [Casimicrobiaceae bacterium]|nr:RnfH family protein [Casimicrobiaceae bacterium]